MDIALAIEHLVPQAKYGGSVTANTKEAYEAITWNADRKKPSWSDIQRAYALATVEQAKELKAQETTEQLIERKIKELVSPEALRK